MAAPPPPSVPVPQRTVAAAIAQAGIGVHTGERARAEVRPAPFGTGLVFRRGDHVVAARIDHVVASDGSTTLGGSFRIGMVEHVLAALFGAGVTDAEIAVEGPELPILDGSAKPWADGIAAVGTIDGPPADVLVVTEAIRIEHAGGWALIGPGDGCDAGVEVAFGPGLPNGAASVALGEDRFREEVAWARTFVIEAHVARLVEMGRGKGASPENTVLWGPDGPRVPLRAPDEAVRHKLLDLVGDLALIGRPVRGSFHVVRGSHSLHHAVVRRLLRA